MESKRCSSCKQYFPLSSFYKNRASKDGHAFACKICMKGYVDSWVARNPERTRTLQNNWDRKNKAKIRAKNKKRNTLGKDREYKLKYTYGLTAEMFDGLLVNQDHSCPICQRKFSKTLRPCVDHCHTTGMVRGILCNACNTGLGFFRDNTENLSRATQYLQRER